MTRFLAIFLVFVLLGAIALSFDGLVGPAALLAGFVVVMHLRTRPGTEPNA